MEIIGASAFESCWSLTNINLPDKVSIIKNVAFTFCKALERIAINNPKCIIEIDEDNCLQLPPATVIYGYCNSLTQAYAQEYGNPFVSLEKIENDVDGDGMVTIFDAGIVIDAVFHRI